MSRYYSSQQGDPRWIVAKYDGTSANGERFRRGDRVLYFPRGKTIFTGAKAEQEWASFESAAADEQFMSGGY